MPVAYLLTIKSKLESEEFAHFCQKQQIKLAILFGSLAQGRATEHSDVDLALLIEPDHFPREGLAIGRLKQRLVREMTIFLASSKLDLVLLNRASALLKMEVARKGKVLYQKEASDFASFVSLSLREHEDARLFYQLEKQYLINKYGDKTQLRRGKDG